MSWRVQVYSDGYSRQELLGAMLAHAGSGADAETDAALDALVRPDKGGLRNRAGSPERLVCR